MSCDCSCHDCCVPLWASCGDCGENHPEENDHEVPDADDYEDPTEDDYDLDEWDEDDGEDEGYWDYDDDLLDEWYV